MSTARGVWAALLVAPLLCCAPRTSFACACCSEEGQHVVAENGRTSDQQIAEMSYMKFGAHADLYVGAGDKDDAKGIRDPSYQYGFEAAWNDNAAEWKFTFRSEDGNAGALSVPIKAARVSTYKLDIHDGAKSAGGGPLLYKEWKFRGRVRGDGIFKSGVSAPAEYTLIFQGRGNNCDSAVDFTHWRLEVTGSKADFAFTGQLLTSGSEQTEPAGEASDAG